MQQIMHCNLLWQGTLLNCAETNRHGKRVGAPSADEKPSAVSLSATMQQLSHESTSWDRSANSSRAGWSKAPVSWCSRNPLLHSRQILTLTSLLQRYNSRRSWRIQPESEWVFDDRRGVSSIHWRAASLWESAAMLLLVYTWDLTHIEQALLHNHKIWDR